MKQAEENIPWMLGCTTGVCARCSQSQCLGEMNCQSHPGTRHRHSKTVEFEVWLGTGTRRRNLDSSGGTKCACVRQTALIDPPQLRKSYSELIAACKLGWPGHLCSVRGRDARQDHHLSKSCCASFWQTFEDSLRRCSDWIECCPAELALEC